MPEGKLQRKQKIEGHNNKKKKTYSFDIITKEKENGIVCSVFFLYMYYEVIFLVFITSKITSKAKDC